MAGYKLTCEQCRIENVHIGTQMARTQNGKELGMERSSERWGAQNDEELRMMRSSERRGAQKGQNSRFYEVTLSYCGTMHEVVLEYPHHKGWQGGRGLVSYVGAKAPVRPLNTVTHHVVGVVHLQVYWLRAPLPMSACTRSFIPGWTDLHALQWIQWASVNISQIITRRMHDIVGRAWAKCTCRTWSSCMCHQNVTEPQATEYHKKKYTLWVRSSYKHAAYRLVQHTPHGGRRKHSSHVIWRELAPIAVARSDRPGDFNTGNISPACGYPYRAVHPSVWLFFLSLSSTLRLESTLN